MERQKKTYDIEAVEALYNLELFDLLVYLNKRIPFTKNEKVKIGLEYTRNKVTKGIEKTTKLEMLTLDQTTTIEALIRERDFYKAVSHHLLDEAGEDWFPEYRELIKRYEAATPYRPPRMYQNHKTIE